MKFEMKKPLFAIKIFLYAKTPFPDRQYCQLYRWPLFTGSFYKEILIGSFRCIAVFVDDGSTVIRVFCEQP